MEDKTKFVLIGLLGVSAVFIFLFIQALTSKQFILRERDDLKKENALLLSKAESIESSIRGYENKIGLLNKDLDRISREKQELERRLDLASKEKQELIERLKTKPVQPPPAPALVTVAPEETQDVYWAGILKVKKDLEWQLDSARSELKTLQMSYEELQREKGNLELDINTLRLENRDSKHQLEYEQKLMDSLAKELVREKNDKMQIQDLSKLAKSENKALSQKLKKVNNQKANLDKKLQRLQEEKAGAEQRLKEMENELTEKTSQINVLKGQMDAAISAEATPATAPEEKESVELPPIVVRPQPEPQTEENVNIGGGKILAINKENNFVIINLGEDNGIKVYDTFKVYRQERAIAVLEVIQTRRNISACDIKKESEPVKIEDSVR